MESRKEGTYGLHRPEDPLSTAPPGVPAGETMYLRATDEDEADGVAGELLDPEDAIEPEPLPGEQAPDPTGPRPDGPPYGPVPHGPDGPPYRPEPGRPERDPAPEPFPGDEPGGPSTPSNMIWDADTRESDPGKAYYAHFEGPNGTLIHERHAPTLGPTRQEPGERSHSEPTWWEGTRQALAEGWVDLKVRYRRFMDNLPDAWDTMIAATGRALNEIELAGRESYRLLKRRQTIGR